MSYKKIPLASLIVNPANDRHGELENETAAIAQIFAIREQHMRNLARDVVAMGEVFEPPLVFPDEGKFVVADGNRRTTCLKLIDNPARAPTVELQEFFKDLRESWKGSFPTEIECRVETDRDRVDDILHRRHTGVQGGIGQSTWDDRMKNNFVVRTGKSSGVHVADEIEKCLAAAGQMPARKIPRANMSRLLSSEALRNKVGISIKKGKLEFIRDEAQSIKALKRIADDLSDKKVTLEHIWSTKSKRAYLDGLEREGVLPTLAPKPASTTSQAQPASQKSEKASASRPVVWPHIIPDLNHGIVWTAALQRHRQIWEELQFHLELSKHPNAISVLVRVLIELSIDYYIGAASVSKVSEKDSLAKKTGQVADVMLDKGAIDKKYRDAIFKLKDGEGILSINTLNSYVHSPNFNVSPEHLKMIWSTLSPLVVLCLSA